MFMYHSSILKLTVTFPIFSHINSKLFSLIFCTPCNMATSSYFANLSFHCTLYPNQAYFSAVTHKYSVLISTSVSSSFLLTWDLLLPTFVNSIYCLKPNSKTLSSIKPLIDIFQLLIYTPALNSMYIHRIFNTKDVLSRAVGTDFNMGSHAELCPRVKGRPGSCHPP